eukprot:CAMPEP_0172461294 /NCGR_PEP_ID=MMETSP1065-20121228/39943_1 /TAXON_ID=265537 /ORGANISM="Amphiprora paludosa, Strain CCMP125" /LENGTH=633 /DNA_ID=CAMNT_0013216559 /DNA_START=99 /DNA_END=2000 /DNA_ORIENTATION=-
MSTTSHRRRGGVSSSRKAGSVNSATSSVAEELLKQQRVDRIHRCCVCARIPYRGTEMLVPLMNEQDGVGLDYDEGIYEYIYKMAQPERDDSARVDHATAVKTKDRCARHNRKLQAELAKAGIIKEAGQKYSGDSPNRARMIAPFQPEEIRIGNMLGTGGFSAVYEIVSFRPDTETSHNVSSHQQEAREYLTKNAQRKTEPGDNIPRKSKQKHRRTGKGSDSTISRYALKHLRRGLTKEPERFERAAIDLVLEAQLLLAMDHPNIVSLRGWSHQGVEGYHSGRHTGFFIIIDRLPETLEDRIFSWRASMKKYRNRFKLPWAKMKYSSKLDQLFCERLQVAHDIAAAVEYMHDRRIINRDLKASNIGFDIYGELKLFDFGLSRLLPSKREGGSVSSTTTASGNDDSYLMSRVGTKYYMAPEIRKKEPYGLSADVFSYGICLWEILSVGSPREALKKGRRVRVANQDTTDSVTRCPVPVCKCWPEDIANLLKACVANTPVHRPPVAEVRYVLEQLTEQFMNNLGLKRRMDTSRRRSTLRIDLSLLMDINTSMGSSVYGESNTMVAEESVTLGSHDYVGGSVSSRPMNANEACSVIETSSLPYGTRDENEDGSDAESKREIGEDEDCAPEIADPSKD